MSEPGRVKTEQAGRQAMPWAGEGLGGLGLVSWLLHLSSQGTGRWLVPSTDPRIAEGERGKARELRLRTGQGRRELESPVLVRCSAWTRLRAHRCY